MTTRHEVKCVNKTNRYDPYDRIRGIGGTNADGTRWYLPQEEGIRDIKQKRREFFVRVDSKTVRVIVATSRFGHEYLKTEADGEQPNNLLSLPECP